RAPVIIQMFTDEVHPARCGCGRARSSAEGAGELGGGDSGSGGGLRHVVTRLGVAVVLWMAGVTPAAAQLPQIGVPKGELRLEIGGDFAVANSRLFGGV